MTFPVVEDRVATIGADTNPTDHSVDMPSTVVSGELLLIFIAVEQSNHDYNTPSGWTKINETDFSGGVTSQWLFGKVADGTEDGTTVTFTKASGDDCNYSAHCYRISGHNGLSGVEIASTNAQTGLPNPPSLSPSWGSADTLWIVSNASANDDASVDTWPTNYSTNGLDSATGQGTNDSARIATSYRTNAAASEDPGVFDLSESENNVTFTVGIEPAAVGDIGATATLAEIEVDENSSTITLGMPISAELAEIEVEEYTSTVSLDMDISGALTEVLVDENSASVSLGMPVSAALDTIEVDEYSATVSLDQEISAALEEIEVVSYSASVSAGFEIDATLVEVEVQEYNTTVDLSAPIPAALEEVEVVEYSASVSLELAGTRISPLNLGIYSSAGMMGA